MTGLPSPAVLRLLDANANRAREALRVIEDYARFIVDDSDLSAGLKQVRHDLVEATTRWTTPAILNRDTPGDVGTRHSTEAEHRRTGIADVVTVAGKRLGEALRAIEEFLKTVSPEDAQRVESIRYRFYDLELRTARTLLRPAKRFASVRLYVLITESVCRRPWLEAAEAALAGGADCLQLREKELESGELLRRARLLTALCRKYGAICIINDRPDITILSEADGVHVGQGDLPLVEARKLVGPTRLVGVSTHDLEQARAAQRDGADYVGIGPCFVSGTKTRDFVVGIDRAGEVSKSLRIPAVAIAGITAGNVDELVKAGVGRVAVTAAVVGSEDPKLAAQEIKRRLPGVNI